MEDNTRSKIDELLDLLADEVLHRASQRSGPSTPSTPEAAMPARPNGFDSLSVSEADTQGSTPARETADAEPLDLAPADALLKADVAADTAAGREGEAPANTGSAADPPDTQGKAQADDDEPFPRMAPVFLRLAACITMLLVLVNLPIGPEGRALARSIPEAPALIIVDGSLLKEADKPEVWLYRDGTLRWVPSLAEFQRRGLPLGAGADCGAGLSGAVPQGILGTSLAEV